MKVLLLNGSPHENGCTFRALTEVRTTLGSLGIAADIFQLGTKPVAGCAACNYCSEHDKCVYDDRVNEFLAVAREYDGFVFGSPVYYGGPAGQMKSFMDRVFYSCDRSVFAFMPVFCVCSARRAGTTATLDVMQKYFFLMNMFIVTGTYWPQVHGFTAEDVERDTEGLQTMRNCARNMAWFLRLKENAAANGIPLPDTERGNVTNFIREA